MISQNWQGGRQGQRKVDGLPRINCLKKALDLRAVFTLWVMPRLRKHFSTLTCHILYTGVQFTDHEVIRNMSPPQKFAGS